MKKKKFTHANASSRRQQKEALPWKYFLVTIFFGVLLAAGFFHAARLHFFSMEFGAGNHELRNRIEDLKAKSRKLKLNKELAMSPAELKDAARKLGLTRTTVQNLEAFGEAAEPEFAALQTEESATPAPVKTFIKQPSPETPPVAKPLSASAAPKIVKTVKSNKTTPAAEPSEKSEKKEDAPSTTRSRIIDTAARR